MTWIPVSERLPDMTRDDPTPHAGLRSDDVLVFTAAGGIYIGCARSHRPNHGGPFWSTAYDNFATVTHWQPLPQPPDPDHARQ